MHLFGRPSLKRRSRSLDSRSVGSRALSTITMGCANGKPILTAEDLDFIAQHTAISREEVESQHDNFLHSHPDGKIGRREFKQMVKQCYPSADTDKLERHLFRMYDSNQDGHIDFREFMLVLYVLSNGSPEANLRQIFRVFDINNDGAISRKEMKRIIKDLYTLIHNDDDESNNLDKDNIVQSMFGEMDADADGKITQDEFVSAIMAQEKISSLVTLRIIDIFISE